MWNHWSAGSPRPEIDPPCASALVGISNTLMQQTPNQKVSRRYITASSETGRLASAFQRSESITRISSRVNRRDSNTNRLGAFVAFGTFGQKKFLFVFSNYPEIWILPLTKTARRFTSPEPGFRGQRAKGKGHRAKGKRARGFCGAIALSTVPLAYFGGPASSRPRITGGPGL